MTVKEKKILSRYYKRRFCSGRGAFARAADFVALRVILLAAIYIWFSFNTASALAAILLSILSLGAVCIIIELIKAVRLERFIERENRAVARRLFTEGLVMRSREELLTLIRGYIRQNKADFAPNSLVYAVQTVSPLSEEAVLRAYRTAKERGCTRLCIFSSSSISEAARSVAARCDGVNIALVDADMLSSAAGEAQMSEIHAYILSQDEKNKGFRRKRASTALGAPRAVRYGVCAAALFILSFFVPFALYYRALGTASASLGALSLLVRDNVK